MKNKMLIVCAAAMVVLTSSAMTAASDPLTEVDPFIGTTKTGNTTPAATWPFGQVQPGPDTTWKPTDQYGRAESGYRREHGRLLYFTQTHLSGTGCADFQDVGIRPVVKDYRFTRQEACCGYYACTIGGVDCEMTASKHVAHYRFRGTAPLEMEVNLRTGPDGTNAVVVVETTTEGDRMLVGKNVTSRWLCNRQFYYAFSFSEPFKFVRRDGDRWFLVFGVPEVQVRAAVSKSSVAGAKGSIAALPETFDFDARRGECEAAWRGILSRAKIEGPARERRIWYTSLYHACFQPNLLTDAGEPDRYSTFSTWDTYRAAHPLYTILVPELVPDFIASMMLHHARRGKLAKWELWGEDVFCMPGWHSVPPILDAVRKGLAGDTTPAAAFKAVDDTLRKRGGADLAGIMEDCYDDWCAAELAKMIDDGKNEVFYRHRMGNWTNFYDRSTGYIRGKAGGGRWVEPFDPFDRYAKGYCEGSAAHWSWHVLHDPALLVSFHGGPEGAFADLEKIFRAPENFPGQKKRYECTGPVGQHAHGNEHCQHVPYYYALIGHPERTAEIVREICTRHYGTDAGGVCGNDDCGQMSAWYVFSAAGFYPFNPASGEYVIGAPQVPRVEMKVKGEDGEGKTFTVIAKNLSEKNKYVKSVALNGRAITDWRIRHADIVSGGTLVFEMVMCADGRHEIDLAR